MTNGILFGLCGIMFCFCDGKLKILVYSFLTPFVKLDPSGNITFMSFVPFAQLAHHAFMVPDWIESVEGEITIMSIISLLCFLTVRICLINRI